MVMHEHQNHKVLTKSISMIRCTSITMKGQRKIPNDKFPTDTNIDYMHSPNTHIGSKSSNFYKYSKHLLENSYRGVNTEGQRINQNTSFLDDQYDGDL